MPKSPENTLDRFAREKLDALEAQALRRRLIETDRREGAIAFRDGRRLVSFCCNDYLNLSQNETVKRAAIEATEKYGVGSGASRLVSGNHPLFRALELRLAEWKQAEDCVVFGSGYMANMGIIPALVREGDLILADELAHACLLSGSKLSGARVEIFRHNDMEHLRALLAAHRGAARHCLILTDGIFSMDGDAAPVEALAEIAARQDAWLMTDDAHGLGVVGREGRGSSFLGETKAAVPLQMGTLSKAVGAYGGYLCASRAVCDLIRTRARTLIYSTGLPPATAAAAIAALDFIRANPDYCRRPVEKAKAFTRALGLPDPESPIVPLILGDAEVTLAASALLEAEGYLVTGIRPPTVPEGTARLRFTFTAEHDDADIARLASLVRERIIPRKAAE
ncbi:MAG: 8-amino-7-oxononanoate synthase [Parvibaculum sp.]|uniref:8-amino-7-oxononanoate synthase n=1 Tax=Parvibaculum sp. TaxID=2024848 RepID=UPI002ABC7674|nr:8-amino-7-oxononanoate synthase [Parvibaculum sp.]MDZ4380963.1 8-amino-7-oxononanoate synthase [Parvibaculum sp.]